MDIMPVNPLRTDSGALVALVQAFGSEAAATPVPLEDPHEAFTNFNIVSDSLSSSAAATLGVGTIFKGQFSASEEAFYFDAVTFTDKFADQPAAGQQILGTRWGVGLRILLRVEKTGITTSLNFGLVGAAVELNQAHARYEILGIGLGADAFVSVLGDLPVLGSFDYETYLKINGPIQKNTATYIRDNQDKLVPQPIGVALARSLDPFVSARAVYLAMNAIILNMSESEAHARVPVGTDLDIVRDTYAYVTGSADDKARPSDGARQQARDWLNR